jgi:protein-S-isoprenylcysteine O-methyltransferase Ste14
MHMFWIVLSVLLWGLLHSLSASLKAREWARQILGPVWNRFYRLAYNIFSVFSFLPVLVLAALTPDRRLYLVPLPWSGLMVLGELLAVAALVLAFRQTDMWEFIGFRQLGETDKPSGLTTSGLYHYVRHPLYSAGLAFIWLMPLMTVNVLAINLALTVYVVIGAVFEERKLRREFGQAYVEYAKVTPMFIPFLKGNKSPRKSS